MHLHCYRLNRAGCETGAAAVATIGIEFRPCNAAESRAETDCCIRAGLAADSAFHITLGEAGLADAELQRPRQAVFAAAQRTRAARAHAFGTEGTLARSEIDFGISSVADSENVRGTGTDASAAPVAHGIENFAPDGPGRAHLVPGRTDPTSEETATRNGHFHGDVNHHFVFMGMIRYFGGSIHIDRR